jgi:hypothetical protein
VPACGHDDYERVEVKKFDGTLYGTEFVACAKCRVMAWRPELTRVPRAPDFRRTWGSRG